MGLHPSLCSPYPAKWTARVAVRKVAGKAVAARSVTREQVRIFECRSGPARSVLLLTWSNPVPLLP